MHTVLFIMSILLSLNLASALFHLIPGAFRLDEIIPEKYLNIALAVFGGVYLFFIIERLLRFAMVIRFVFIESAIVPTKETRNVRRVRCCARIMVLYILGRQVVKKFL